MEGKNVFLGQVEDDEYMSDEVDFELVPKRKEDNCFLCQTAFNLLKKRNFCKRCGRSACEMCSQNKRRLSTKDKNKYKICDKCDHDMSNKYFMKKMNTDMKERLDLNDEI
jgi:hypothetical protein